MNTASPTHFQGKEVQVAKSKRVRKEYKGLKKEVQSVASAVSREILKNPENTRDVWLGNLVEYIAALGAQNVEYAGAFLQGCFRENQSSSKDEL